MKKLLLKSMLLLYALIVGGVNSAWADDVTCTWNINGVVTAQTTSGGCQVNTALKTSSITPDGTTGTWTAVSNTATSYAASSTGAQLGAGSNREFNGTITLSNTSIPASATINSVTVTAKSNGTSTLSATIGGNSFGTNKTITNDNGTAVYGDYSFTGSQVGNTIVLTLSNTTASKYININKIVVVYTPSSTPQCATPTFDPAAGLFTSAQNVALSCATDGATIRYTTDGTTPTSTSTAYSAPINVSATTTIKAIAMKDSYENSNVASATYTIVGHAGTQADPYTVADARAAIDANSGITDVYVTGIVCTGGSNLSSGKMNYWISDDGTETNKLEAYKGKNLNNTDFAATSDVGVNDVVVIYGTLAKFGSTYEFIEGNYLVSLQQSTKPIINANNKTINFDATSGEIAYTIENPTSATLTAAKTTGDWISNVAVDAVNNKVTFTATANTGAQRQGTITLSYTGADDKVITVTQKKYGIATLPFAFDGGKGDIESTDNYFGLTHDGLGSDYGSSPKLKFDGTGDNVILRFNEEPGILSFSVKGNSFSGGTFTVQTSADGTAYTDLDSYTTLGDAETKTYNLESSVRYVKWIYTSKSNGNVALGNINLALPGEPSLPVVDDVAHTVTLTTTANMEGWRTFTPSKADQNYTADADVYYVSASGATTVTLTKIDDGVPANTPVILHKTSGTTITLTETATDITAPGASNLLAVSTANQNLGKVFRLGYKSGAGKGVGFYSYTSANAPAGIIYVNAPSAARDFLNFDFGDEATGVNDVRGKMSDVRGDCYDLQGRKVANPTKGLYIVNGKKVIIK